MKKRAFTLIELLVVISIISLLAAILFPVFARAREQARKASCASNLKQIGLGSMMYVQDHDEAFPPAWEHRQDVYWYQMFAPYIKNEQVFICPTAGEIKDEDGNRIHSGGYAYNYRGGQTLVSDERYNGFGYRPGKWQTYNASGPIKLADIDESANTILITDPDSMGNSNVGRYSYGYTGGRGYMPTLHGGQIGPFTGNHRTVRRGGGGNYLFADGHVKYLTEDAAYNARRGTNDLWNVKKGL